MWIAAIPEARAGFIGYYAPGNFTFTDIIGNVPGLGNPNGIASFPDLNTLVLTGSNDGTGLEGTTDLTIAAAGTGVFRFTYAFTDLVTPTPDPFNPIDPYAFPYGGYLIGGTFVQLSNGLGHSGSIEIPVAVGVLIGFRVGGDNQGGPGILTITDFAAPVPEPATWQLLSSVLAAVAVIRYRRRVRRGAIVCIRPGQARRR